MSPFALLPGLIVVLAAVAGAVADRRGFRLPNRLTLSLLAAGCLWNIGWHHWAGLGHALAGSLVGAAVLLPVYIRGGMGAGDVKMLAAVGAWLGPLPVLGVFLVAGLAAGAWSVVVLRHRSQLAPTVPRPPRPTGADFPDELARKVASPRARQELIPFGILIALGVITQFTIPLVHHFLFVH